jgi:hypothetical protein
MIDLYLVISWIKLRNAVDAVVGQELLFIQMTYQVSFLLLIHMHTRLG